MSLLAGLTLVGQLSPTTATDGFVIEWCNTVAAHGTSYDAVVGQETCIPLCIDVYIPSPPPPPPPSPPPPSPPPPPPLSVERRRLLNDYTLDIRVTDLTEPYPVADVDPFKYPFDEVNFPKNAVLSAGVQSTDPNDQTTMLSKDYCFTPTVNEECAYTVCFMGYETGELFESAGERCFRINVYNEVLHFDECEEAGDMVLSTKINSQDGLTMSAWIYPSCSAPIGNQTVMYFGSDRDFKVGKKHDEGLEIRNAIKWSKTSANSGSFYYYDCDIGAVMSESQYECDVWHYVAVTVAPDHTGYLYVDGVKSSHELPMRRDLNTYTAAHFTTSARPDDGMDRTEEGVFMVGHYPGECFIGYVDEIKVFNYPMTQEQVFSSALEKDVNMADDPMLKGYFTMSNGLVPTTTVAAPTVTYKSIPPMIPCVLGMEHSVGPTSGDCTTEVYGWNFADSVIPQCSFDDVPTEAQYVDESRIICNTPMNFSPSFVTVKASNNGVKFSLPEFADKTTTHLFLESSLYLSGGIDSKSGASADSVCEDFSLDSKAVTVGTWACPKCGPQGLPLAPNHNLPCSRGTC